MLQFNKLAMHYANKSMPKTEAKQNNYIQKCVH